MVELTAVDGTHRRREERKAVEMFAHLRRERQMATVMLKDFSHGGARVAGLAGLERDEPLHVTLPGCRPILAFVAWADGLSAGLEFADPVPDELYKKLVSQYALGKGDIRAA